MRELKEFLERLRELKNEEEIIDFCRKYLIHGIPYIFTDQQDEYYEFRKRISHKFDITFYEIYITGSASYGRSEVGDYKVSAGVFKSYSYFERYTISTLKQIINSQIKIK